MSWNHININIQNVKHETARAFLIAMPHSSEFDGFSFWVSKKLLRGGSNDWEIQMSVEDSMTFKIEKKNSSYKLIDSKEITADDMIAAFGGKAKSSGYHSRMIPEDDNAVYKHEPARIEPVKAEADETLVR